MPDLFQLGVSLLGAQDRCLRFLGAERLAGLAVGLKGGRRHRSLRFLGFGKALLDSLSRQETTRTRHWCQHSTGTLSGGVNLARNGWFENGRTERPKAPSRRLLLRGVGRGWAVAVLDGLDGLGKAWSC